MLRRFLRYYDKVMALNEQNPFFYSHPFQKWLIRGFLYRFRHRQQVDVIFTPALTI